MTLTAFPNGIQTSHIVSAETVGSTGRVFWVGNSAVHRPNGIAGADVSNAGGSPLRPFATVDYAVGKCVAGRGDTIFVMEGHAETFTAAAGIAIDVAGVRVIGLGEGDNRPTFTLASTDNSATITQSGNNTVFKNCIIVCNDDGLTNGVVVSGNACETDLEFKDTSSAIEFATALRLDTADNFKGRMVYKGFTAGNATVSAVRIDDCDNVNLDVDFYGVASTSIVEAVDFASTNVKVTGKFYNSGTTNLSKNFIDTITGSTWTIEGFDGAAGAPFSGGSGNAIAAGDLSVMASAITAIDDILDTEFPVVATAVGAVADAALADTIEGAAAATQSILTDLKGVLQRIGADNANNTAATTLVAANADGSLFERLEYVQTDMLALPRCVEKSDGTVTAGAGDNLFTISGGPIHVLSVIGIVTTEIEAGAANIKLQITTTTPAATVDMSAGAVDIDGDVAGTSYSHINTTAILTPVTAGFVMRGNAFATNETQFLCPIGTILCLSDAAKTGNIKWYLRYIPLSPNSRVVAAA